ncbi:hypothetical protein EXIGLDRAFT_754792 [Exidia glandulosa HHB12029]|uniref:F-box domain-containing protein n=1 Tax=Exidia glandulosa HHB12029 TaxID=1314781 RepID=A0A165CLR3_EXIGL|nr:hypothetical protein EXIGLDRAFT_754792 [Exidia glandulosa HHB12029]
MQSSIDPTLSAPVDKLNDDLLSIIFLETCTLSDDQLQVRTVLSHVCHRWRNYALACASLWTNIDWRTGMSVERALVYLDRSAAAHIAVSIRMIHPPRRALSAADISDCRSVLHNVVEAYGRISNLQVTVEYWDEGVFAPLLRRDEPLSMPHLQSLAVSNWDATAQTTSRPIRIGASNLREITIDSCRVRAWPTLAGQNTTRVHIGGFTLMLSDLVLLLLSAPNLSHLSIGAVCHETFLANDLPDPTSDTSLNSARSQLSAAQACRRLQHLDGQHAVNLGLLCAVLPTTVEIPYIGLIQSGRFNDDWMTFLSIESMAGHVSEIIIAPHAHLVLIYSGDQSVRRLSYSGSWGAYVVHSLFSVPRATLCMTVRRLSIGFAQWPVLLDSDVRELPDLRSLNIRIDVDKLDSRPAEHRVRFPALKELDLDIDRGYYSYAMFSTRLVRSVILLAIIPIVRYLEQPGNADADFRYRAWTMGGVAETAFRESCEELAGDDSEDETVRTVARRLGESGT